MPMNKPLSRRDFLKMGALGLAGAALRPWQNSFVGVDFPDHPHLARVAELFVNVRAQPDINSALVTQLDEDEVVPWLREFIGGRNSMPYRTSQRWVETPVGYIWSPLLQPVKNLPNTPLTSLPDGGSLGQGTWVEVSIPWVDVLLENDQPQYPSTSSRMEQGKYPRFYYSQVFWVDSIKTDENGQVWYHLIEHWAYERFWGPAEAFRPVSSEEVAPISPGVENKRIDINLERQTLSCFEDEREVYFCRCSTGVDEEEKETPPGLYYYVWRKMMSAHMIGGTTGGGYDLPGVGYTTLFVGEGIAIHSTFWHNNFGERTSHGCVNVRPEDAKWIWRWVKPEVGADPGDITVSGQVGSNIRVLEA